MDLLFDKNSSSEIKKLLGFVNADYKIANIITDIEQATDDLIHLIGVETYTKLVEFYSQDSPEDTATDDEKAIFIKNRQLVKRAQLPVISFALIAYENNLDVEHSGSGRPSSNTGEKKTAWKWQQEKDESATRRRAYKGLDMLIDALDKSKMEEWLNSNEYKESKELFINTTKSFQKIWPIFQSRQLLLRLRPFMIEAEEDYILPLIGSIHFKALKEALVDNSLLIDDYPKMLSKVRKSIAYYALSDAYRALPVEMFPDNMVQYSEKTKTESDARHEKIQYFRKKFFSSLDKLECFITKISGDNTPTEIVPEFNSCQKFISL